MGNGKIKLNKFTIIIASVIEFLANVFGIITAFNWSQTAGVVIICVAISSLIIGLTLFTINFFQSKKGINLYKKESNKKQCTIISDLHHVIHDIRNTTYQIQSTDVGSLELLETNFKQIQVDLCDDIEQLYGKLFDRKTSVCLKIIDVNDIANNDYKQWRLSTFARGHNSATQKAKGEKRNTNDNKPIYILQNSDFHIIVDGLVKFFDCPDMKNIRNDFFNAYNIPYKNSRDENGIKFSDYYNSTIVVPIRIEKQYRGNKESNCNNFHLLGFLCIDTLEPFVSEEELAVFKIGIEYAKTLADSLYYQIMGYFAKNYFVQSKILVRKGMETS